MEKIEINYSIPDQKSDITLETWLKFEKIATEEDNDPDFLQKKMLEIFCDLKYEVSSKMKQVEIDEILGYLNKVLGTKSELHQTFDFEGKKYGLIPDFDKNITAGELIDLDKYLEIKDYPRLLSILYRASRNCTEGTRNTTIGVDAGSANTNGGFNLIAGMGASQIATYLNGSTILGQAAGNQLTSAENNTFVGRNAGANITTGSSNLVVAAGNFVAEGSGIISGNNNTIVGTVRGLGDVSNNVVIADGEGNVAMRKDASGVVSFPSGSVATDEIIMTSPNGTRWRVRIDDAGTFSGVIE